MFCLPTLFQGKFKEEQHYNVDTVTVTYLRYAVTLASENRDTVKQASGS